MQTDPVLDSALRNFLGTYVSRSTDLGLFGLLLREWNGPLEFDLLAIPPPLIAESKTRVVAEARAIDAFHEQMTKSGLEVDSVVRATLFIDRPGSSLRLTTFAETRGGEAISHERILHDLAPELRSTRTS